MAREPEYFREMIYSMRVLDNLPPVMSPTMARTYLGVSKGKWAEIVNSGGIKIKNKLVSIEALAKYLCS